jgi:transposase
LEATGSYGDAVAEFLFEKDHFVSIVNPMRIKGYAQTNLQRNKTDKADAKLIADFCRTQKPDRWQPPSEEVKHLQSLTRRISTLEQMLRMEKNRLETATKQVQPSIKRIIKNLDREIETLRSLIKDHLDNNPDLKQQSELLQTIPGIGDKTANLLLSEVEFARYTNARQIAAQAGVTPRRKESGTSLKRTNLSKLGNVRIRKALYFPAVVAKQHNEIIKEFATRLEKRGKTQMQIICAAMRKLLHIAFGVLKHKTPFDPNLAISA